MSKLKLEELKGMHLSGVMASDTKEGKKLCVEIDVIELTVKYVVKFNNSAVYSGNRIHKAIEIYNKKDN